MDTLTIIKNGSGYLLALICFAIGVFLKSVILSIVGFIVLIISFIIDYKNGVFKDEM